MGLLEELRDALEGVLGYVDCIEDCEGYRQAVRNKCDCGMREAYEAAADALAKAEASKESADNPQDP